MKTRHILRLIAAASATLVACSGDDTTNPTTPSTDAGSTVVDSGTKPGTDAGGGGTDSGGGGTDAGGGGTDAGKSGAHVRVAHLAPDAPAVDFCVAVHGTTSFIGPVLKGAGAAAGLSFGTVTKYLDVPAAQYDVRLVAPGSADCAKSLAGLPDIVNLPALGDGVSATLAAEGELATGAVKPFGITPYIDDSTVAAGKAKLRFVHASPGTPAVDVGLGGGVLFTSVFTNVAFGAVSTAVGTNGYLETPPIAGAEISARAHGAITDVIAIKPAALPAGAIATAFAIGKIGDATHPLKVLLCVDNGAPTGVLGACTAVGAAPERAHVRVAHLSPDAPAVDVCIKPTTAADFTGSAPLLKSLGATAGLSYPQVTTFVDLPIAAYDIRIVLANAADCKTGAVPDTTNIAVTNGLYADVAATGELTPAGTEPKFALKVFPDENTVATGKAKLRFVHASPGTPAVDVGLGTGAGFTKVFSNVAFGAVDKTAPISANGYLETDPISAKSVTARIANATTDALTVPNVTLPANAIATAFAIGNKTGDAAHPLKVLLCVDTAAPTGLLAACNVAP